MQWKQLGTVCDHLWQHIIAAVFHHLFVAVINPLNKLWPLYWQRCLGSLQLASTWSWQGPFFFTSWSLQSFIVRWFFCKCTADAFYLAKDHCRASCSKNLKTLATSAGCHFFVSISHFLHCLACFFVCSSTDNSARAFGLIPLSCAGCIVSMMSISTPAQ